MEKYVQFILFYHEPKTSINKEKKIMEKGKKILKLVLFSEWNMQMKYIKIKDRWKIKKIRIDR